MGRLGTTLASAAIVLASCSDDGSAFETELDLGEYAAGDIIALRAEGVNVEYVSRRTGEIYRHNREPAANNPELLVTIDVGTDGEQRGLLGHTVIDGRRFAAWPTTHPT